MMNQTLHTALLRQLAIVMLAMPVKRVFSTQNNIREITKSPGGKKSAQLAGTILAAGLKFINKV